MSFLERTEVEERLDSARAYFLERDRYLLEVAASERSITHKFAEALQQVFEGWNVDCEYNRAGLNPKSLTTWAEAHDRKTSRVFPDIIVHRRGGNCNVVAIEGKRSTASKKSKDADWAKLLAFKRKYDYEHAVQLTFTVGRTPSIDWEFVTEGGSNHTSP